jgi:hypothetical protein
MGVAAPRPVRAPDLHRIATLAWQDKGGTGGVPRGAGAVVLRQGESMGRDGDPNVGGQGGADGRVPVPPTAAYARAPQQRPLDAATVVVFGALLVLCLLAFVVLTHWG